MATPAVIPTFQVYRGDTFERSFLIQQLSDSGNPDSSLIPVDLTSYGSNWLSQFRKSEDDPNATMCAISSAQLDVGIVTISLTSDQTTLLPAKGEWDIQVSDNGVPATVRTLIRGTFALIKDVSR